MSHYFDESPVAPSEERLVDVLLPDMSFTMRTDRGVFSHGRLDTGTNLLLRSVDPPPSHGDLLDLGCGAGAIALTMARRAPDATVWAVDVNARARDLCSANAAASALANVRVAHPDEVDPRLRFAAIWSNPPIRVGKATVHELLGTWLNRLAPGAVASLVVQRHLGSDSIHRWLEGEGFAVTRLASKAGYRVLAVNRP